MSTPEATLKGHIRDYILGKGGYYFAPVQMGMGVAGLDIYACIKGRFVAIEAKAPGKFKSVYDGCTARQKSSIKAIQAAGGIAFAADSMEDVRKQLSWLFL